MVPETVTLPDEVGVVLGDVLTVWVALWEVVGEVVIDKLTDGDNVTLGDELRGVDTVALSEGVKLRLALVVTVLLVDVVGDASEDSDCECVAVLLGLVLVDSDGCTLTELDVLKEPLPELLVLDEAEGVAELLWVCEEVAVALVVGVVLLVRDVVRVAVAVDECDVVLDGEGDADSECVDE